MPQTLTETRWAGSQPPKLLTVGGEGCLGSLWAPGRGRWARHADGGMPRGWEYVWSLWTCAHHPEHPPPNPGLQACRVSLNNPLRPMEGSRGQQKPACCSGTREPVPKGWWLRVPRPRRKLSRDPSPVKLLDRGGQSHRAPAARALGDAGSFLHSGRSHWLA